MSSRRTWKSEDVTACTCANLRRATRAVTQLYDGALQPVGITTTQFTLLAALDHLGRTPISDLAGKLGMDRTTLTRTLRPLKDARYVRVAPGTDRRMRYLRLTSAGERKLAEAMPLWKSAQRHVVRRLGNTRWSALLDHIRAAADVASP